MASRATKIVLGVAAVLVAAVAVAGAVAWTHLPAIATTLATRAAGRPVTIGTLRLSPGRWLGVELRDATYANLPGGTRPAMATLGTLTGELALWPLLHGQLVARSVQVADADILLEHVNGQPNWRNGPKSPDKPGGGRDTFPTVLGATMGGVVTFRTRSGTPLVTRLNGVKLEAPTTSDPAHLVGPGSYQDAPVALDLKLGSFDQLHDLSVPFPTDITLTSGDTVVHFDGTMTDPLDVNGATGHLDVAAPTPAVLEKVTGAGASPAPPIKLAAALTHDDPRWILEKVAGSLGNAPIEDGTLHYTEGSVDEKKPDDISLDLRLGTVDLDRLLASFDDGKGGGDSGAGDKAGFVPDAEPNPLIKAKLAAAAVSYASIRLSHLTLAAEVAPGQVTLNEASAGLWGGQAHLDAHLRADSGGKAASLGATLSATGLDVAALSRTLGAPPDKLTGRIDLRAAVTSSGTASAALRDASGAAVATMAGGTVSAQWVELAATDVAALLRSPRTTVPLGCLLAVVDLRNGTAEVGPLRLRSAAGTIVGRGEVNIARNTLDMVVASEARTTGALALDVPVRVSGKLDSPSVAPAGGTAGQRALSDRVARDLPAPLRDAAQRSPCAR